MKRAQRRVNGASQPSAGVIEVAAQNAELDCISAHPNDISYAHSTPNATNFQLPSSQLTFANASTSSTSDPASDTHFLVLQSMRTHDAFSRIAAMLQLKCTTGIGIHVSPECLLPPSLAPTYEQQTISHGMYVDLLPWPSLRSSILAALSTINQQEFTIDMGSDQLKVWGPTPWDPMGWEIGDQFLEKWWFLIDASILQTTNFWRRARGETPLIFPSHKSRVVEVW
jgi:Domain of unknown function (DUF3425)